MHHRVSIVQEMLDSNNLYLIICGVSAFLALLVLVVVLRRFKHRGTQYGQDYDDLDGHEFEVYCAQLLQQKGFLDVEVTRGSGDFGVDILAEKDGITYAIQCKCYSDTVGVKAVQEVYAGRDYYDRMVGVVLTNQYFTTPAVEAAKKLKVVLWDRGYLESMVEE